MPKLRILVVDDEQGMLEVCAEALQKIPTAQVLVEGDSGRAAQRIRIEHIDLLVADICMPGSDGMELLRLARQRNPHSAAIMMTGYATIETAIESLRLGASDYLTKPFDPARLTALARNILETSQLREENRWLRRQVQRPHHFKQLLCRSDAMHKVLATIDQVAAVEVDVMIVGETGTGKELVAGAIHQRSRRRDGPFVPVNCSAIPEALMENEFFGHERGAYTGAQGRGPGLLEIAQTGTFFLDELSQLPFPVQAKLLRVVQERTYRRVGGTEEIPIDVRFVTASSIDLSRQVKTNQFREDLYQRLHVVQIDLPPLRDRPQDILLLAEHFCAHHAAKMGKAALTISPELMEAFTHYPWPGNVRELENVLKRMVALAAGNVLRIEELPPGIPVEPVDSAGSAASNYKVEKQKQLRAFEKDYFSRLITAHAGDISSAARTAGLPRWTVYRLARKHGIVPADYREDQH